MLALDYRFMDWGKAKLGPYAGQPTSNTLSFGELRTNSLNFSVIWPF